MAEGIFHFLQAGFSHGKYAKFINRAKAVFLASQGTKATIVVAFQHHETVDHMFEYFRSGQVTVFGDMTHQKQGSAGLLGILDQISRAFAHLADTAGGRGHVSGMHHLDRVDDDNFWLAFFGDASDFLDIGFGEHFQFVSGQAKAFGAHAYLLQAFLTGHIEGINGLRHLAHDL